MRRDLLRFRGALYRKVGPVHNISSRRPEFREAIVRQWSDAEKVIEFLQNLGVDPVIIGGVAVQHHGYERTTEDVDILIDRESYARLSDMGEIRDRQLVAFPDIPVDVLTEGEEGEDNPDPSVVRAPGTHHPTFEGLIYLKLKSGRTKDSADIVELLKHKKLDPGVKQSTIAFLKKVNRDLVDDFKSLWSIAEVEASRRRH